MKKSSNTTRPRMHPMRMARVPLAVAIHLAVCAAAYAQDSAPESQQAAPSSEDASSSA
jgi:hypothetical protein